VSGQETTRDVMIACARRELAMRKNVYPKWVAAGRMKQDAADKEIAAMQAIHDALMRGAWRPRETAPKDRPILSWDGTQRAVVQFQKGKEARTENDRLVFSDAEGFARPADPLDEPDGDGVLEWWEFTHWCDLHAPPKEEAKE
jgi:hypothetical protein